MKKQLFYFFFFLALITQAQFFRGFGIMGGLTLGKEKWLLTTVDANGENAATEKIKHKYLWGYNAELFAEFVDHDVFRWRTEFEFDKKGTKHRDTDNKNKLNYISWNNYLVVRYELYEGIPYFLAGPRVEYTFAQNTPDIPYGFKPFHFSWSAGAGFELITFGPLKPMIEVHYNPDIDHAMDQETGTVGLEEWAVRNRAWEIRLGFILRFNDNSCPPVFK